MTDVGYFDKLLPELLTLILSKLSPAEIVHLFHTTSKAFRKKLLTVKWNTLISLHHREFALLESNLKENKKSYYVSDCDQEVLDARSFAKRYYLLTKFSDMNRHCIPEYGVCDSVEQLAKKFPLYIGVIYASEVCREKGGKREGFRWHKWGAYVGNFDISGIEYLNEATGKKGKPKIESQVIFKRHQSHPNCIGPGDRNSPKYKLYLGKVEVL